MNIIRAVKTYLRSKFGGSDKSRWSSDDSLNPNWDERTIMLGRYIRPGDRVIEFGAGKMALRNVLPEGCTYLATDIVSREPGMLAVDLNQLPLPDLGKHDIAVFSGVFEYLTDVSAVLSVVGPMVNRIAASYMVFENKPDVVRRRANGCVNDYTEAGFIELFGPLGFSLTDKAQWKQQVLFYFEKKGS
ncbi:MAG: hypothetical protein WCS43_10970 [Verrucomicrobiota bacterium]